MDKDTATFSVTNELETNPSFSIKGRDREIFYNFVMEAGFSIRVTNVLLANVESLEAFEELTEEDLYGFRNCGRKTVREIVDFLKTFGVQKKSQTPVAIQTSVPIEELFFKAHLFQQTASSINDKRSASRFSWGCQVRSHSFVLQNI